MKIRLTKHDKSWMIIYLISLAPFMYIEFFLAENRDYTDIKTLFLGIAIWFAFTMCLSFFWALSGIGYHGGKIARGECDED